MLRSLSDAVSGLQAHQTWLDVIGNDIANVSTPGFQSSDVNFASMFSQVLTTGSAPTATSGGTNPLQIGLGVGVGSITTSQAQGALQQTGNTTDLAIQGSGYFLVDMNGQGTGFTRIGDFSFDKAGNLVEGATGFKVQGWLANAQGTLPSQNAANLQDLVIPQTVSKAPVPTANVHYVGNLDAATPTTSNVQLPVTVYDGLGNASILTFTFTPTTTPGTWNWTVAGPTGLTLGGSTSGTVNFSTANGGYVSETGGPFTITPTGGTATTITPDFSGMTQYASATTAYAGSQDGFPAGTMTGLSIDKSGTITGHFSNGLSQVLGQVAVATFTNPSGLVDQGQGIKTAGNNSGLPAIGVAGSGAAGVIASGSLEGSNVDLAQEFTEMITAERGFQANAQVVTTANQVLQTLTQL